MSIRFGLILLLFYINEFSILNAGASERCEQFQHLRYGFARCVEKNSCESDLLVSGDCQGYSQNFQCCFMKNDPPLEEFRAVWVATVENIDWPSSNTKTTAEQQAELISILNLVQQLNMNAVVFQIRPAGDAFYNSTFEPWSYYLTGTQGVPPSPYWDPLAFLTDEAHKRGIEVHAWMNPYRARTTGATYSLAPTNMADRFPQYAYPYAKNIWMDPGATIVQEFILNVTEDIVRNYNVDGIHMDDYFYPYSDGTEFPDAATYAAYQAQGGLLNISDWRRDNVNKLIQAMYIRMHAVRPKIKFGISPFGIWKSGVPAGISGLSSYDSLYCDSRLWLQKGWVDYMTPQLYWAIDPPAQSYPVLLKWWTDQSIIGRHIYPGNAVYRLAPSSSNWPVEEIVRQIDITRSLRTSFALGNVFFSYRDIFGNIKGIQDQIAILYKEKAIVPKMNWL